MHVDTAMYDDDAVSCPMTVYDKCTRPNGLDTEHNVQVVKQDEIVSDFLPRDDGKVGATHRICKA